MKQRIRVVAIIRNENGVLILKRNRGRSEAPVFWELPTGKIKFGEQPEEAIVRSLEEYTSLNVSSVKIKDVITFLAKGDVALSVSLTAISSVVTLFTLPPIMVMTMESVGEGLSSVSLPVKNLLIQNLLLMFLPLLLGMLFRHFRQSLAQKVERVLGKLAFPMLMFLAGLFFVQNMSVICDNFLVLGASVTAMLLLAVSGAWLLAKVFSLKRQQQRTIIIEVGMQNAAQAIAVASSPFIFNSDVIAVPAIIYALMMNVILLIYVGVVKRRTS